MIEWKNVTPSGFNKEKKEPTMWTYDSGKCMITITKGHIHNPGRWIMHCFELKLDTYDMNLDASQVSFEDAQRVAIEIARNKAQEIYESLRQDFLNSSVL